MFFGLKHLVKISFCVYAPIIIAVYNYNTLKSRCQVIFSKNFIKFLTTKNGHPICWVSAKKSTLIYCFINYLLFLSLLFLEFFEFWLFWLFLLFWLFWFLEFLFLFCSLIFCHSPLSFDGKKTKNK